MIHQNNSAVSPVVGVMLMLVVVIIIAAVVSAFAGGMVTEQHKTPQASIQAKPFIESIQDTNTANTNPDNPSGFTAKNGLLFEHNGGDSFSLDDIYVVLQKGDTKYTLTTSDTINRTSGSCLPVAIPAYFNKTGSNDKMIKGGDRFMLYADNCKITSTGNAITWKPEGANKDFPLYLNDKVQFKIVDRISGRVVTSGEFFVE
jgi:FlaG/FlaF family flagellin (archaellin)